MKLLTPLGDLILKALLMIFLGYLLGSAFFHLKTSYDERLRERVIEE